MNRWVKVSDFQYLIEEHIFLFQKIFCGSPVKYSNLPPLPPSPCLSLSHTCTHTCACAPREQVELVCCCGWGGRYRHLSSPWLFSFSPELWLFSPRLLPLTILELLRPVPPGLPQAYGITVGGPGAQQPVFHWALQVVIRHSNIWKPSSPLNTKQCLRKILNERYGRHSIKTLDLSWSMFLLWYLCMYMRGVGRGSSFFVTSM